MVAIVLDAMGSDQYPNPEIEGAILAAKKFEVEIILVGNEEILADKLRQKDMGSLQIRIIHAPDVVEMSDKAVASGRAKPMNSMAVGLELVKSGEASAFVTAGNTGAAMFNGLRKLGRIKGVLRPALGGIIPVKNGHCIIIDLGANADCRPDFLLQFGIMGSIYAQNVLGVKHPRVGLISNGEEAGKGNQLVKDTFPLLEKSSLNFVGNIEGKELFSGEVDVAVADGFTGNVLLKASEAVAKLITDSLKDELSASMRTKIGAMLALPAFRNISKMMNPSEVGAAPLLGIDGLVFVGHGRSDAYAIMNAIKVANNAVNNKLLNALSEAIQIQLQENESN